MKQIILCLSFLLLVVACAAPPTNKQETASATNTNSYLSTNSTTPSTESDSEVIARERSVWEALKNKEYGTFGNFLAQDQLEVSEDGVTDKNGSMEGVKAVEFTELNFSEWRVLRIDPDLVVTTYRVAVKGKHEGKDFPPLDVRASSAWVHREGKWQAIFHQSSSVETMPPPTPNSSTAKAASPAPTSATTATTGSDPVANEKLIWDLFRAKNYDAFAALIDDKALEVNPSGVFEKEGIIKGVQTFDATKAELSEFKTLNIDKDAAMVIYTVRITGPKPELERHSTLWVNRDGKWLAAFHHGTMVKQPKM